MIDEVGRLLLSFLFLGFHGMSSKGLAEDVMMFPCSATSGGQCGKAILIEFQREMENLATLPLSHFV